LKISITSNCSSNKSILRRIKFKKDKQRKPSKVSTPLLEAIYLLQVSAAAIEALQVSSLFYGYTPSGVYRFMSTSHLSYSSQSTTQSACTAKVLSSPLLALLLYTILIQIKSPNPSRKQSLHFELLK
jgi:hypothetical protein